MLGRLLSTVVQLGVRLGIHPEELVEVAAETIGRAVRAWPVVAEEHLATHRPLRSAIDEVIRARRVSLRS